jgi:hypothetical protein
MPKGIRPYKAEYGASFNERQQLTGCKHGQNK